LGTDEEQNMYGTDDLDTDSENTETSGEAEAGAGEHDYDERALDQERDGEQVQGPAGPVYRVSLDWVELEGALENNSPELHSFLNRVTGDVIRVFRGSEDAESRLREIEISAEYVYIEPISSREQYRWMEEYIEEVQDAVLKDKLNIAIDGKGAFRRFKDVLVGYPVDRESWFAKRAVKLRAHMTEWLAAKRIEPTNLPPWEIEGGDPDGDSRVDADGRARREGSLDLRQVAHELLDIVSSRELPGAVAFLEFLRSRRGSRRPRGT
jgi:hypothetical protein